MLSPQYLAGLSDELIELFSQLEADILSDMARRIARLGGITETTAFQARVLMEAGLLKHNIARVLKDYDARIVEELTAIFTDAMMKNARADNRIFQEETGRTLSDSQAQIVLASVKKVHSDLSRLTLTTAETSNAQFIRQANRAYMNVASGAFNYTQAIKQATDELAKEGLHTRVTYNNSKPVTRSIEAAVRMNVLTGVNQTAAAVSLTNCEELGCDLVEVSAHVGARPEHEAWQGKIYKLHGSTDKYPNFYETCRYGEADGICGVNCRHSFYPYFEGQEKHYAKEDLDEWAKEKVTYNEKEMTRYEGEQQLRKIERNIRFYKKKAAIEEAAKLDNTAARQKIGEWQAKARDFSKQ
ncbi:MAG: phage minor capsid protein, partial [Treponema sp.]